MEDWKEILREADEDYLIGISNKGIVKRAYKDKEEGNYEVLSFGSDAIVRVGGENVQIKSPLGDSICSCPSRSICRHVVLGILALKERMEKQVSEKQGLEQKVREEIAGYPLSSIRRVLSGRQFQDAVSHMKAAQGGNIRYSSTVTVELPWMGQKVKLLSPLAYSSCTCHKKEFCPHKAAAILWCQLEAGQLTIEELEKEAQRKPERDKKQIEDAARQTAVFIEELLNTGLARIPSDATDYMERLAIISHNARLAKFEGYWRALKDSYDGYLKRKASFCLSKLTDQTAKLYRRAKQLLEEEDGGKTEELSGEFRAEYVPVGDLDLIGIAMEHFESQAGYEGETIYFLEANTKEWYSYTLARPVFYEKSGRRRKNGKAGAPWGLALSMEELAKAKITLTGAKCDGRRRLSSSQDTKGEIIAGNRRAFRLCTEELGGWYYRDFGLLYEERVNRKNISWLEEKEGEGIDLVFLRPASIKKACFSETEQKLFMNLYDEEGREVIVEVAYSQKEARGIRYLERIEESNPPCFFGKIYHKDGKIRMYPVAVLEKEELLEDAIDQGKPPIKENVEAAEPCDQEKEKILETLLKDVSGLLEELYQSGFNTVHDSTLQEMEKAGKLAGQCGMEYLEGKMKALADGLSMRRHQLRAMPDGLSMRRHQLRAMPDKLAETYAELIEYLYLCRTKITLDMGRKFYQ